MGREEALCFVLAFKCLFFANYAVFCHNVLFLIQIQVEMDKNLSESEQQQTQKD